jgi:glycosyltransferase involved in cell wall biosynthesis
MKHFLPYNRVLWVNTIMRAPRLTVYDLKRGGEKIISWLIPQGRDGLPKNLSIVCPFMIPYHTLGFIRSFNKRNVIHLIKKAMAQLGMRDPILLTTLPIAVDYIGSFSEIASIYYCVDEFSEWPGVEKSLIAGMEQELMNTVDRIIVTSHALLRSKKSSRCPTFLLTHGVDYEHFSQASSGKTRRIETIQEIRRPIIGYFGLLDERVDLQILEDIVQNHPEWSILIIGKVLVDTGRLQGYSNLYLIGSVPYVDLPHYGAYFDACILPYKLNQQTASINPLKLREYLAMGKPVISTDLPEVTGYGHFVKIAANREGFVQAIEECLEKGEQGVIERQLAVRDEDWMQKAEKLSAHIEDLLLRKEKG